MAKPPLNSGRILARKVAVVTGAARGIGRAACVAFAQNGADVVGIDICTVVDPRSGVKPSTVKDLDATGDLVRESGQAWRQFVLDQRDIAALRSAVSQIEAELGHIDVLFANADSGFPSFTRDGRPRLAYPDRCQS